MNPKNTPVMTETVILTIVIDKASSVCALEPRGFEEISSSIDIIKNINRVVPKPKNAPNRPIVYLKNFLPTKAMRAPKIMRRGPAI